MDTMKETLEKVAAYIADVQPRLDAENARRSQFLKRANQAAGVLANRGIIGSEVKDAFVDKVAANEVEVWDLVEKLAGLVAADDLGTAVQEKLAAAGSDMGPWERLYYLGDARAEGRASGMVD